MGLNIVLGCKRHQVRMWVFRGHEDHAVAKFYREHWRCAHDHQDNVVISDDQSSHAWVNDERWAETTYEKAQA